MKQLLIDADFYLYMCAAACEKDTTFPAVKFIEDEREELGYRIEADPDAPPQHVLHSDEREVMDMFSAKIRSLEAELGGTAILIFSGRENFRKSLWHLYKASRKATRKPLAYWDVIARLTREATWEVKMEACLEGDDYIGILATRPSPTERIVVSDDKDMQTLPNITLYRMGQLIKTTAKSAEEFWMYQTLAGDSTDGYKGCPGCGDKGAEKVLEKPGDMWENVRLAFQAGCAKKPEALAAADMGEGFTSDDFALLNARLARILRFSDWDSKARQPILWTPPVIS